MAIALVLLGAFIVAQALQLKMTTLGGGPGPGVFPAALGTIMVALGLLLAPAALRERTDFGHLPRLAGLTGVLVAYAIILDLAGFVIATSIAMAVMLAAFNERHRLALAALGVAGAVGSYALFSSVLHVQLPADPWFIWP